MDLNSVWQSLPVRLVNQNFRYLTGTLAGMVAIATAVVVHAGNVTGKGGVFEDQALRQFAVADKHWMDGAGTDVSLERLVDAGFDAAKRKPNAPAPVTVVVVQAPAPNVAAEVKALDSVSDVIEKQEGARVGMAQSLGAITNADGGAPAANQASNAPSLANATAALNNLSDQIEGKTPPPRPKLPTGGLGGD